MDNEVNGLFGVYNVVNPIINNPQWTFLALGIPL